MQRAFLALSDKMKHEKLRFASGTMGSVWADFEDEDGVAWRAALDITKPLKPNWSVVLYRNA